MISILKYNIINIIQSKCNNPAIDLSGFDFRHQSGIMGRFDLEDQRDIPSPNTNSIAVALHTGTVSYQNMPATTIVDYERFFNDIHCAYYPPNDYVSNIKRVDYLLFSDDQSEFFILNELSQGSTKESDAKRQFIQTIQLWQNVGLLEQLLRQFAHIYCILSMRQKINNTPEGMADSFLEIDKLLSDRKIIKIKTLQKKGIYTIATDTFDKNAIRNLLNLE